ncbi:hypothetical protein [Actinopolyspora halophila]|uniref:hypothetical protein n=1 Tax=Actinopolyspora halophila TaxID=1850 RepID=UPI00037B0A82|nr:hypothetical protein [Actinopolyspora halophila]
MPHPASSFEYCPACGKKVYNSRSAARKFAKKRHRGKRLTAYRCPTSLPWRSTRWHLGHVNTADRDRQRRMETRA